MPTSKESNGGDLLKLAVASLAGAFISGVGAYVTLGRDVVHTGDLPNAVEHYSPYNADRAAIQRQLDITTKLLDQQRNEVEYLRDYARTLDTRLTLMIGEVQALQTGVSPSSVYVHSPGAREARP